VIHALSAILTLLEVNAIQSVGMEAEMMMKNVMMETLMMRMVVLANALSKITMFACLLTPQRWDLMSASVMQNLYLPLGLNIGAKLK
jgi:hypothetical protein